MQIQVNSDTSLAVTTELSELVEARISSSLERFTDRITRAEVHLSDVNGERFGTADKRCLLEVRLSGLDPVAVTAEAATPELAASGAAQKMQRLLTSTLGRSEARS